MADFLLMEFMKGNIISIKVDKMDNILKNLQANGYCSRNEGEKK